MQSALTAARTWLETELHPIAPWALLTLAIWLGVYLTRKYAPAAWAKLASWGPSSGTASHVAQALPALLAGTLAAAAQSGADPAQLWKGALAGALAPLAHHALKALPGPYQGAAKP
jgi:hypothetical protein